VPPDLETDAVHVMTIHRAKGLDFEHVYVAQIHKGGRGGGRSGQAAVSEIDRVKQYQLFGWATPGFAAAEWEQGLKTRAEIVRLLYVAATRAKARLVISGGWGPAGEEVAPESASTFAKLIARRLDAGRVAEQISDGAERVDDVSEHVARVLPVFSAADEEDDSRAEGRTEWTVPAKQLKTAEALDEARTAAAERMAYPVFRSASAEAHHRLRQAEADGEPGAVAAAADRDAAMALGTAVHSVLETLDLERELAPQVLDRIASLAETVSFGDTAEEAAPAAEALLRKIAAGECLARLQGVAGLVVARELPVLVWDDGDESAPGTVVSGLVDLVYRDPDDGRIVAADYKTDRVDGDAAVAEKTRVYEPQVRTYARALRTALDLDYEPHTELWFLAADRIIRI
jgi:ATP-dependent helicase/nuclease subunit A